MSIFRNILMSGGGGLPSIYQQVEYIQSVSGYSQYINLGIKPTTDTQVKMKFNYQGGDTSWACFMYAGTGDMGTDGFGIRMLSGKLNVCYSSYSSETTNPSTSISTNTDYEIDVTNNVLKIQGGSYSSQTTITGSTSPISFTPTSLLNLYLFGGNNSGSLWRCTYTKLYYLKIYQDNILVRDLIPCYIKSSGVIGLYDLVSKTFFTNQGSGTFTKGGDV